MARRAGNPPGPWPRAGLVITSRGRESIWPNAIRQRQFYEHFQTDRARGNLTSAQRLPAVSTRTATRPAGRVTMASRRPPTLLIAGIPSKRVRLAPIPPTRHIPTDIPMAIMGILTGHRPIRRRTRRRHRRPDLHRPNKKSRSAVTLLHARLVWMGPTRHRSHQGARLGIRRG